MEDYLITRKEKHKLFQETYNLANKIYRYNIVGGLLHIVLDDGNLKNHHIEDCINHINTSDEPEESKQLYLKCTYNLLKMTPTQRLKLYNSDFRFNKIF